MTRQPKDRHMTTPEPGLPHGPLTAEMVPLLTAGRSMLVLHAPAGPSSSRGDLFIFDHDAPEFEGRVCVRDCANGGPPETWHVNRFTYIGERAADRWVTAPVGGWVSNPLGHRRTIEVEYRDGTGETEMFADEVDWPMVTAFRLPQALAALPDAEQVKGMGALATLVPTEGHGAAVLGVYVASRASIPERGEMWRKLRASGVKVTSSWIDEDGPGETADFADLWPRIQREVAASDALICYLEPDDFPIKGVLIEIGMAFAASIPVRIVAPAIVLEGRNFRPLGSWIKHPLVSFHQTIADALAAAPDTVSPAEQVSIGPLADEPDQSEALRIAREALEAVTALACATDSGVSREAAIAIIARVESLSAEALSRLSALGGEK